MLDSNYPVSYTHLDVYKRQTSKQIAGEVAVFVLKVNSKTPGAAPQQATDHKKMLEQMYTYRADQEFYTALKEKANIENHTGRFE